MSVTKRWPPPALGVRTYRWYWLAQWPTLLGTWMQTVALSYLVYSQTHSATAVGAVAAAAGIPAVVLSLVGGVIADRVPRRRILLVTQSVLAIAAATLALLVLSGHAPLIAILAVAITFGATDGIDLPARQAMISDLVKAEKMMSAVALGQVVLSTTRIVGPALGGFVISVAGPGGCFLAMAIAYLAPLSVLWLVIPDVRHVRSETDRGPLSHLAQGFRAVRSHARVRVILILGAILFFFGTSLWPFMPVLVQVNLHGDAQVLGLIYGAGGIGGLIGGVLFATIASNVPRGRVIALSGVGYAVALFWLTHAYVFWAGAISAAAVSFTFVGLNTSITTFLQTEVRGELRGRIFGIYSMCSAGLYPLGALMYGVLSHIVNLFTAVGIGGLIVGVTALAVGGRSITDASSRPDPSGLQS
jgi:MFS family permease